jgi:hypothetical protein
MGQHAANLLKPAMTTDSTRVALPLLDADRRAMARIADCRPVVRELLPARVAVGLVDGELGHAGPPFAPGQAPSPVVLGALAGAVVHEGWAGSLEDAAQQVLDGRIRLRANHSLDVVSEFYAPGHQRQHGQSASRKRTCDGRTDHRFDVAQAGRHVVAIVAETEYAPSLLGQRRKRVRT